MKEGRRKLFCCGVEYIVLHEHLSSCASGDKSSCLVHSAKHEGRGRGREREGGTKVDYDLYVTMADWQGSQAAS